MGLRNLTFKPAVVTIPGGDTFTVRGLTPDLVMGLYNRHRGDLSDLFDYVVAKASGNDETGDPASIVVSLLGQSPAIMAELIAIASGSDPAGDPEEWEADNTVARQLPLPVQIDALMKISEATFSSDMPPGKFMAVVVQMAGATTALLAARKP